MNVRENNISIKWYNFGTKYYEQKNFKKAINCFNHSIALNSNFNSAWYGKGLAYLELIQYDNALSCFSTATNIDYEDYKSWHNLAWIYSKKEDYIKSLLYYKIALSHNKNDKNILNNINIVLEKLKKLGYKNIENASINDILLQSHEDNYKSNLNKYKEMEFAIVEKNNEINNIKVTIDNLLKQKKLVESSQLIQNYNNIKKKIEIHLEETSKYYNNILSIVNLIPELKEQLNEIIPLKEVFIVIRNIDENSKQYNIFKEEIEKQKIEFKNIEFQSNTIELRVKNLELQLELLINRIEIEKAKLLESEKNYSELNNNNNDKVNIYRFFLLRLEHILEKRYYFRMKFAEYFIKFLLSILIISLLLFGGYTTYKSYQYYNNISIIKVNEQKEKYLNDSLQMLGLSLATVALLIGLILKGKIIIIDRIVKKRKCIIKLENEIDELKNLL